jgi:3-oxoacyl-[acyl-carrier protein] reductase
MDLGLRDKKALVCGASRGLGYAVAEALMAEGAEVFIHARGEQGLRDAAARLQAATGRAPHWHAADLTIPAEREQLYQAAAASLGEVQLMLVNAGGPPSGPFASHTGEAWHLALELALGSMTHLCGLAIPQMQRRGFGRIAQIVSIAGLEVLDGLILSNASRPAALGFAKALAREVAPHGILVNSICPGIFLTDRVRDLAAQQSQQLGITREAALAKISGEIPVGRPGEPREVGDLAAYLLSPRNTYMTGAAIPIDGARTRRLM